MRSVPSRPLPTRRSLIGYNLGQFVTGYVAIGQFAAGDWLLCVKGIGEHVWSVDRGDPEAVQFFQQFSKWFGF